MSATTQIEIELLRNMGSSAISLGQQYHQYADFLEGKPPAGVPNGASTNPLPTLPPGATPPPPFPAAAPAPTPAAPAGPAPADGGKRKRRTKEQIALDDAAVAAGYTDHADMLAKAGGNAAGNAGVPPAPVQPLPGVPANQPPALPPAGVAPPPPPPAAPPAPAAAQTTPHDHLQAALMGFGNAVESVWPGQGHGNGQMGVVIKKMGVPTITAVPAESVQQWTDWIVGITAAFRQDPSKLAELTR